MLNVKKLSKYFHGKQVLHEIDLEIKEGEIVTIIGPSGSGKSTLLRCLKFLISIQIKQWEKILPEPYNF